MATKRDRRTLLLAGMTLANAMVLVDQTAVPLALPAIIRQFGVGDVEVQWVLNASLLPLAALLVLGGRLGDLIGRRRVFLIGSFLFAGASALGGLAPSFTVLLIFRVLQGTGGALMLPNTIAIVSSAFPPSARGRVLGTMGGAAAVAGALGPTIGGLLTSALSWRAVLLVNVPLAVVTISLTAAMVPRDHRRAAQPQVDVRGAVALGIALASLVFGLAQSEAWGWGSPLVLGSLILSVVAAACRWSPASRFSSAPECCWPPACRRTTICGSCRAFSSSASGWPSSSPLTTRSASIRSRRGITGQASGVSATAEQFGGAIGIAALYLLFHSTYLNQLVAIIDQSPFPHATPDQLSTLRNDLQSAEQSGLRPASFPRSLDNYLLAARTASDHGYAVAFLAVSALAAVALVAMAVLIRMPAPEVADQIRERD